MTPESIARICHEVNRVYCESIGDHSQVSWGDAPDWQKKSAVDGVRAHIEAGGLTPAESHARWMAHKIAEGWRYGPTKDSEAKTHPCLVEYDALPVEQRVKDKLFGAVVAACL